MSASATAPAINASFPDTFGRITQGHVEPVSLRQPSGNASAQQAPLPAFVIDNH